MKTVNEKEISIFELADGALNEEVKVQLRNIAANIADLNTDWKKTRKLTISISFNPTEDREVIFVSTSTKAMLAPSKEIRSQLMFGADRNGEIIAVEIGKVPPGQQNMFGEEEKKKILKLS